MSKDCSRTFRFNVVCPVGFRLPESIIYSDLRLPFEVGKLSLGHLTDVHWKHLFRFPRFTAGGEFASG